MADFDYHALRTPGPPVLRALALDTVQAQVSFMSIPRQRPHALQRTRPSRSGCNRGVPRAWSLSLGRLGKEDGMIPLSVMVWALRIAAVVGIVFLCFLASSGIPSLALALVWGPNGIFLSLFMRGALHLPRFLEPVKAIEPVLYRWVGVGLVKRIVSNPLWPMMHGFEPPPKLKNRQEFLDRTEHTARGAEICHAATFISAFFVALLFLAAGRIPEALWILAFNLVLNGYPVMLQRVHRWRLQQVRARFKMPR